MSNLAREQSIQLQSKDKTPSRRASRTALSRREFLATTATAALGLNIAGCKTAPVSTTLEPIIDIHQHLGYSGRADNVFLAHQDAMGISRTILLPAGRPTISASTITCSMLVRWSAWSLSVFKLGRIWSPWRHTLPWPGDWLHGKTLARASHPGLWR